MASPAREATDPSLHTLVTDRLDPKREEPNKDMSEPATADPDTVRLSATRKFEPTERLFPMSADDLARNVDPQSTPPLTEISDPQNEVAATLQTSRMQRDPAPDTCCPTARELLKEAALAILRDPAADIEDQVLMRPSTLTDDAIRVCPPTDIDVLITPDESALNRDPARTKFRIERPLEINTAPVVDVCAPIRDPALTDIQQPI